MQNQFLVSKLCNEFKIHAILNIENSTFLINLLFQYVEQGKITFELKSKKGSIVSEILINVVGGVFSAILYDLAKNIHKKLKENKNSKSKVNIFTENKEYILTGADSDMLPKE